MILSFALGEKAPVDQCMKIWGEDAVNLQGQTPTAGFGAR
jgi:hypothetical protein